MPATITPARSPGPARHFREIEAEYGRPVEEWQHLVYESTPASPAELIELLCEEHAMEDVHARAIVSSVLRRRRRA